MIKVILIATLFLFISACGGGGGGGDDTPEATNTTGFPVVFGRYSFNTSTFSFSCTDGSAGTNPALALNFDVVQDANVITLVNTNTSSGSTPGITLIDSTSASGNIQTNSSFIVTQIATANMTGISGTVTLNYNITGSFTNSGWSGTYTYTASAATLGTCTFTASFTGTKIITPTSATTANPAYDIKDLPVDFYDTFSVIGSSVATK